jgi:two-component system, NarL family, response regulator NreC
MDRIRLLLADDHELFRHGLKLILSSEPDVEVVGEAESGQEAIALAERLRPDVVLMDITMPDMDGSEATRHIQERLPGVRVLIVTMHESQTHFFQVLDAGACGYILKGSSPEELLTAVRAVHDGEAYLCPSVAAMLVTNYRHKADQPEMAPVAMDGLTEREQEVLRLVAEGCTSQQVAAELCISVKTVEHHRAHIMEKLDVHTRAALVRYAIRRGLVRADG